MPTKTQIYADLADRQARQITESRETWTNFLDAAGRLYKYPFEEQLLIHAQRPDAQACASFDFWHEPMNRYIKKGSKGIALLDTTSGTPRLKYVFDYADTADGRRNPHRPFIWELKPEHEQTVAETLARNYDIPASNNIGNMLYDLAQELSTNYYNANDVDIQDCFEDTYLEDYDEYDRETSFIEAMTVSTAYTLMKRCGIDPTEYISDEDFQTIFDFNAPDAVYALGKAVSTVTEDVLRDIEVTVKKYVREQTAERSNANERIDVQPTRGLFVPEYSVEREQTPVARQIRNDENGIPERTQTDSVHEIHTQRTIIPPLFTDRGRGDNAVDTDNDGVIKERPAAQQGNRPDGVDSSHERVESSSGGNNPERVDIQLNENTDPQTETPLEDDTSGVLVFPDMPSEQEQIEAIRQSEEAAQPPVILQDDIDRAILDWNGDNDSRARVFDFMRENGRARQTAEYLKNEYGGDLQAFTVTKDSAETVTLSWQKVQQRIGQLMEAGLFILPEQPTPVIEPIPERSGLYQAFYDNFGNDDTLATALENAVENSKQDRFWENIVKQRRIKAALFGVLHDENKTEQAYQIAVEQHQIGERGETETPQAAESVIFALEPSSCPPPVFFVDWDKAQFDFDLSLYNDHDVIGYNKDGVEYAIGRSGSLTYVTSTGMLWGGNEVSGGIYEQINAYRNGELTDEQVRENYLDVLEAFKNQQNPEPAMLTISRERFEELLDNGTNRIIIPPEKIQEVLYSLVDKVRSSSINYSDVENAAEELRLTQAEFGDQNPDNHYGADSYAYWNISGDRHDDDMIRIDYNFNDNGAAGKVANLEINFAAFGIEPPLPTLAEREHENRIISETEAANTRLRDAWADVLDTPPQTLQEATPVQNEQFSLLDFIDDSTPTVPETETQTRITPEAISTVTSEPQQRQAPAANFRITDDSLGEGGAKTKYNYNAAAIRTLQAIEAENRRATPEEQEILSRYVGWGGIPQAFDPNNGQWTQEYSELKGLLTPNEHKMAQASTLNAHYTSPVVIKAMYETLGQLGFKDGNILEPACGVGNFFGLLPDSMQKSKLYGVELDSITGRIAQQLYPNADIKVMGFEKTDTPDAFFDAAIGNVPFGSYKLNDSRYNKQDFMIHDYFFAKTLDQVRQGGIVAFVTSKGTLDKANPEVRKYIAQRAELLGAVRLPNNAFQKNANTEVTTDIIFLQKRDRLMDITPEWVHLAKTDDGVPINSYYADNPHMMLGKMAFDSSMYGGNTETTLNPIEGADLAEQLKTALSHITGQITEVSLDDLADEMAVKASIPADPLVKNYSYALITPATKADNVDAQIYAHKVGEGDVYFRENSRMFPVDMPAATLERVKGMIALRDCTHKLIDYQLNDYSDGYIRSAQAELNRLYDSFTRKNGLISTSANSKAFSADSSYYLLCSLEILNENGELDRKSDMFTKRTIKQKTVITSVDTSTEALAVSIGQKARVDLDFMSALTGFTPDKIADDLHGVIFRNPMYGFGDTTKGNEFLTADEYLSGNVREKLEWAKRSAALYPDDFTVNVKALELAQPKDLDASEISVRLGATWVDKEYIQEFMYELLQTPRYLRDEIQVNYSQRTDEWNVSGKTRVSSSDVLTTSTYGTPRANAYKIMEDSLNLRDVRVYDTKIENGKEQRILNKEQTALAVDRQELIRQRFKDWIFNDPERRQALVEKYNRVFNSTRPREYDGAHIDFTGISPEIKLKPHQTAAIARILYGGNTLLAHEVGAGKTFEMVGAVMESKRLGLSQKSLMAVPNHLTEQMASEFLRLYPSANILVATKKDFETKNRKKFCAKIATGDYDCVIIGHSQLEKIPLSKERQENWLKNQIDEITEGIAEIKASKGERFTIKAMEKTKKNLETRLEKLTDDSRKDSVVTFEQLGINRLFVDEAHYYKNLFLYTKMRNVAGLSTSEALKSSDLFMKCRYLDGETGNKGVIFATGTPISNSMAELYTMQRYLQHDTLSEKGHIHFDAWASNFGETVTSIELSPEGTGCRPRTRFANFTNLPELMNIFKEVADIKTADTLDLPRPKANFHTVVAKPTDIQKEMVQELSKRAKEVHDRKVPPEKDNMLKITSDGRKIGLDQRLINPMLPDDPTSKVNLCAQNVFRIWEETADKRSAQLIFCDFSTPNKDGRFNVYDDIKSKLLDNGVPANEVAFIHDADTETKKKELFAKVRSGQVRVLLGSTFKCGAGTNIQDKLIALHDLDCPWRPADLAQRLGRIQRQGNKNPEVDIFRYVTESTFDSYLFQTIEKKQEYISQIMTSKSPVRSCNDVDEDALSYAEIKALCAGDPNIKEKMTLETEVAKLKMLKADHTSQQYRLEDDILKHLPIKITSTQGYIDGFKADVERLEVNTHKTEESISPMTIGGKTYNDRGEAGAALLEVCKSITTTEAVKIGSYRGFDMLISFDSFNKVFNVDMKGSMTHTAALGEDGGGNITRINNAFDRIPQRLASVKAQLETLYSQQENAKTELGKPFEREQELTEKSARLAELNSMLDLDKQPNVVIMGDVDEDPDDADISVKEKPMGGITETISAKGKPSVLDMLEKNEAKSKALFGGGTEKTKHEEITV